MIAEEFAQFDFGFPAPRIRRRARTRISSADNGVGFTRTTGAVMLPSQHVVGDILSGMWLVICG